MPVSNLTRSKQDQAAAMNIKTYFVAVIGVVATTFTAAQELRVCRPACGGGGVYSELNVNIAVCCQEKGHLSNEAFDKCCASSCESGNPCSNITEPSDEPYVGV
ncbi:PcF and SCR74-like cys-rich secreted peptide, putative [Phytophthora infestans T30-4]|uniref:PcF and SCR74-like cys-rich secreted peptide, putative n=2 Tax=Phytophthora infestans TaxID=4787 RepID=D0NYQ7_PHYIT|nr:PcF and SCR74-like cys-rich secreted peptide, putative [Phytophthora infestans T30-4]EEY68686.1 PcF and SCR74-like cys-rich secreted peptide, putative [Phytophthora infestans T30-4]KAF4030603.1 hypothetical protein GN244_ATG17616 [Phytophthora infestans]|eukprot:XP_002997492.1 PcF and SCR74-like cys-rich secreted peptide, putative [Phytophthora infestans T30-4]